MTLRAFKVGGIMNIGDIEQSHFVYSPRYGKARGRLSKGNVIGCIFTSFGYDGWYYAHASAPRDIPTSAWISGNKVELNGQTGPFASRKDAEIACGSDRADIIATARAAGDVARAEQSAKWATQDADAIRANALNAIDSLFLLCKVFQRFDNLHLPEQTDLLRRMERFVEHELVKRRPKAAV